ncbi:uncharacterized protein LOC130800339 isoform X2 [Amaranthus tricolor]|uniref:uncharacterized protein LOC130800339 isoform X2 n=1 Tax=Amaranthus tricolor TaxID=29722 RepID=UPI00258A2DC6|nr:uncharacterized protein LOC130800339 isoform X2 [Amaranthus tricolor]
MVAISLYRGNLHKPPDKTRRWIMPRFSIPLKEFCALHCRRSKALSLLPCSSVSPSPTPTSATPVANPNLNPIKSDQSNQPKTKCEENPNSLLKPSTSKSVVHGDSNPLDQPPILVDEGNKAPEEVTRKEVENIAIVDPIAPAIEGNDKHDEKEKRTKEVEEKLHVLNERKHNLVQLLKLILNAEEELKRQNSLQAGKPPLPLQVDASNDSGSMTRHATPRNGSEANLTVDMMDIVGDDALNTNPQPRQLLRMSSTSPSAESVLKKPPYFQHNVSVDCGSLEAWLHGYKLLCWYWVIKKGMILKFVYYLLFCV